MALRVSQHSRGYFIFTWCRILYFLYATNIRGHINFTRTIFELSAHVGTVLQDPDGQFIGLTVGEDIAFSLENSCMPQDEMHQITRKVAELVKINNHLDYAPH